jgi:hypothetical protein
VPSKLALLPVGHCVINKIQLSSYKWQKRKKLLCFCVLFSVKKCKHKILQQDGLKKQCGVNYESEMNLLLYDISNCLDNTILGFLGKLIKYVSKMKGCICDNFDNCDG